MTNINLSLNAHDTNFDCQLTPIESKKGEVGYSLKCGSEHFNKLVNAIATKKYAPTTSLKGFRPGKVPLPMVKAHNHQELMNDVLGSVINGVTSEIIKTNKLDIAGETEVDSLEFSEEKGVSAKLIFKLFPEFTLPDFDKIKIETIEYEFAEKDAELALENIAKAKGSFVDAKKIATAEESNLLEIDFVGSIDGTKFEGGSAENAKIIIGSNMFIPGFEEQLKGAKAGDEKTVKVKFPENYGSKDLAGKDAEFIVKIHKIQVSQKAEINEEFAKLCGAEDLISLKDAVKKSLEQRVAAVAAQITRKNLLDALDKDFTCEVPDHSLEKERAFIEDQYKDGDLALSADAREKLASRRVKLGFLLTKVANKIGIGAVEEDFKQAIVTKAMEFKGQEKQVIDYFRQNPSAVNALRGGIIEDKTLDYIMSIVDKKVKKLGAEAIEKLVQG